MYEKVKCLIRVYASHITLHSQIYKYPVRNRYKKKKSCAWTEHEVFAGHVYTYFMYILRLLVVWS